MKNFSETPHRLPTFSSPHFFKNILCQFLNHFISVNPFVMAGLHALAIEVCISGVIKAFFDSDSVPYGVQIACTCGFPLSMVNYLVYFALRYGPPYVQPQNKKGKLDTEVLTEIPSQHTGETGVVHYKDASGVIIKKYCPERKITPATGLAYGPYGVVSIFYCE